jgi:hypothetical protein
MLSEKFHADIPLDDDASLAAGEASGPGARHGAAPSPAATGTPSRAGVAAASPLRGGGNQQQQQQQLTAQQQAEIAAMRGEMARMADALRVLAAERDAARAEAAGNGGSSAAAPTAAEILGLRNKLNALVLDMANVVSQRDALAQAVQKREAEIAVRHRRRKGERERKETGER